ncbi:MAG: hypothetical protein AB8C95_07945 [Phycisphaeraceae bacterium]
MQINSIRVTRDSQSRIDKIKAPHEYVTKISSTQTVEELLFSVYQKLKTADPAYAKATWSITSKRPLAVVSEQWAKPRILLRSVRRVEDTVIVRDNTAYLHFCLHEDADPDAIYRMMDQLSFPYLGESTT